MPGLPKRASFLAGMPLIEGRPTPFSSSPPPPPYFPPELSCGGGTVQTVLEPYRFSPDSSYWYGGIGPLEDPFDIASEEYLGTIAPVQSENQVGVEFSVPLDFVSGSGIVIVAKVFNASAAQLSVTPQSFNLDDNFWTSAPGWNITLTTSYAIVYLDDVLSGFVLDSSTTKIRILLAAIEIDSVSGLLGEIRVNHLTIPYCSTPVSLLPPPPVSPPVLTTPPQGPDEPGTLPPFIVVEPLLPPLPLSPPPPPGISPPLPLGSEILRPNRDIFVRLWQPRPAYMSLNDPLDLDSPDLAPMPLYGPASVDVFDETTGNFTGTIRPRVEVGFTAPVDDGPWDALQLRFRAARSRPPQPEVLVPLLPNPSSHIPASRDCPPDQNLFPRSTDFPGIWQNPPLEEEINASVDNPKDTYTCYMSAPVSVPPGGAAQITLTPSPIDWKEGWDQIKVRMIARGRTAKQADTDKKIVGMGANVVDFTPFHAGLPEGAPPYDVRWNPFDCHGNIHAFQTSITEIHGTGILQTNLDIHADFYLSTQDSDNVEVQVSTDGENYYGAVSFDLAAFNSTVIYYRIALNKGGLPSPSGNIAIGIGLKISGPYVVTGLDLATYPNEDSPFVITVSDSYFADLHLVSQCRVGVGLQGNMGLASAPIQYTDTLTKDWQRYELTWNGFWSEQHIKDLRVLLSSQAILLMDDVPFIDISALDAIISPFCPGLSQPLSPPLIMLNQVDLAPIADVSVDGWSPVPAWAELVSDPSIASDHAVLSDPREINQLLMAIAAPTSLPVVPSGYSRSWVKVEVILQANVITFGSEMTYVLVSTNFGQEQTTPFLTANNAIYSISWDYAPGLTLDQVSRLKVGLVVDLIQDDNVLINEGSCQVAVSSVLVRLTFQDTPVSSPMLPPPPPPVDSIFMVVESDPEVFSCGSLGDCASPQGRIVGKVMVTNPDVAVATVNFIATDEIKLRVSDASDNVYSLSQSIAGGASITYWIYGWVGDTSDPFPADPEDGEVLVSLIYSGGVHRISLPWYYIGL